MYVLRTQFLDFLDNHLHLSALVKTPRPPRPLLRQRDCLPSDGVYVCPPPPSFLLRWSLVNLRPSTKNIIRALHIFLKILKIVYSIRINSSLTSSSRQCELRETRKLTLLVDMSAKAFSPTPLFRP